MDKIDGSSRDYILILDFGSQTSQLLGRRIRELGVYAEVLPGDASLEDILESASQDKPGRLRGIILSGSPDSAASPESVAPDRRIYDSGLPLLGVSYGAQRMNLDQGGTIAPLKERKLGAAEIQVKLPGSLKGPAAKFLAGFDKTQSLADIKKGAAPASGDLSLKVWMSGEESVARLAPGFQAYGNNENGVPSAIIHDTKPWFGLQFHPEVTHCERGMEILAAFAFGACLCAPSWSMEQYGEDLAARIAAQAGDNPVLLLISGGVDSTVVGALLLKALKPGQTHLMYMDTGLMRKDETSSVKAALEKLGAKNLHIIHCEEEFLSALKGVTDPEEKRKIIGDLFITIQDRELKKLGLPDSYFLAQGTLYTDLIESGKGGGKNARLIKSHHNVGSPLVAAKRESGRLLEPLDKLYKDEVRHLGGILGIEEDTLKRHPFPGPGLAVRILGEVTRERCDILREADALFIEELKRRVSPAGTRLYDEIWQAFGILLPIRSVGVSRDTRKYGWVLALRAIISVDGISAEPYPFPPKDLLEISSRITNAIPDIGRVTYDISSKPPATIEWE